MKTFDGRSFAFVALCHGHASPTPARLRPRLERAIAGLKLALLSMGVIAIACMPFRAFGGQIFGYVWDSNGNGLTNLDVYAIDGTGGHDSAKTDGDGYYSINVTNGNWAVSVDCDELQSQGRDCFADENVIVLDDAVEADFVEHFSPGQFFPTAILHRFLAETGDASGNLTNSDGADLFGSLILSGSTLYGMAANGGTNGDGTVFKMNTDGSGFATLHIFTGDKDGAHPFDRLNISGNKLYGVASGGGNGGNGTIFELNTNGLDFSVLYSFTAGSTNDNGEITNRDGAYPITALTLSNNIFYGVAEHGGTSGAGTVFKISADGTNFAVLHTFQALDASTETNSDGGHPNRGLVLSGDTLYGTANTGGPSGWGTVFKLNTDGSGFTVLHSFTGNHDGGDPFCKLILSGDTLYGTTADAGDEGEGVVFAMNTNGANFHVLQTFTAYNDGGEPYSGVILSGGTLHGATSLGGFWGYGTVFGINTDGSGLTILHAFTGGVAGDTPKGGLVLANNTVYGATSGGGPAGHGVLFAISPRPTVRFAASPTHGMAPLAVRFNSPDVDSLGINIVNWNWSFGDGSVSAARNPLHTYAAAGTFVPTLVVTNSNGVVIAASGPPVDVGNEVENGGFEAGTFSGWTLSGNPDYTFVDDGYELGWGGPGLAPYSGRYLTVLGADQTPGFLSQTLATVPGRTYLISMWLDSPDGRTPNEFLVDWNGTSIFDQSDIPATGWTNLQFTLTATGTNTLLQIRFRDDWSWLGLDDIRVVPVSVTAPPAISSPGFSGNGSFQMNVSGMANQNYTVEMSTNLASSNWIPLLVTNTSSSGMFLFDDPNATNSVRYYHVLPGP